MCGYFFETMTVRPSWLKAFTHRKRKTSEDGVCESRIILQLSKLDYLIDFQSVLFAFQTDKTNQLIRFSIGSKITKSLLAKVKPSAEIVCFRLRTFWFD